MLKRKDYPRAVLALVDAWHKGRFCPACRRAGVGRLLDSLLESRPSLRFWQSPELAPPKVLRQKHLGISTVGDVSPYATAPDAARVPIAKLATDRRDSDRNSVQNRRLARFFMGLGGLGIGLAATGAVPRAERVDPKPRERR